jgi:uncharacterized iron-regulated protein
MKGMAASALLVSLALSNSVWASDTQQCVPVGQWLNIAENKTLNHEATLQALATRDILLLGEDHDNVQHHRWQLHTIAKLHALQPDMALGFESFPRSVQHLLDQWVNDELSEKEFLKQVNWDEVWSYDANYYMPMFHFARMHKIPMYALNIDRSLIKRVGVEGWVNIPESDREGISDPAKPTEDYIEALSDIYSQHMPGGGAHGKDGEKPAFDRSNPGFQRFLQSQTLWDRSMAEAAHKAVSEDGHKLFVGIVGAGHIMGDYGIPHQLNDLGKHKYTTLMPWDGAIGCAQLEPGLADYAFGMVPPHKEAEKAKKAARPMLGVYLETSERGVNISKVVPGGIADKLGIQPNDLILTMAGHNVNKINEVVQVVKKMQLGTWLPMTILRGEEIMDVVAKFPPAIDPAEEE